MPLADVTVRLDRLHRHVPLAAYGNESIERGSIVNWNGANSFILYGKGGEIASNDLENQELTMLALHLLQICPVYINTLMIQPVLTEPDWTQRMLPDDLRALTPLIYTHVTPGFFGST
jgi:Tn3 transposase DDE domain